MTTLRQSLPSALQGVGGGAVLRLTLAFLLTLLALAVFAAAFSIGYARVHDGRIVPGVQVAGVSLSGLDPGQAEARLRASLPSVSDGHLQLRVAELDERIAFTEFGRDYDMALMVQQALSVGHNSDVLAQAREQLHVLLHGVTIAPSLTWDGEQLTSLVAATAAMAYIEPVDAQVVAERGGYLVEPAQAGRVVDAEEAVQLAHAAVADLAVSEASVTLQPVAIEPSITTAEAEAGVAQYEMVTGEALTLRGRDITSTIGPLELRGWTRLEDSGRGTWAVVIEREPLVQFAELRALEIDQPPIDATFSFGEESVQAIAGQEGRVVDVQASADAMLAALVGRSNGGGSGEVNLAMAIVQPELTTDEATAMAAQMEELSRWRTNYQPGPLNYRGANIRIPTEKIDGMVLQPGEIFDFWEVVGYPTVEEGYGPGAAIIRGRTVPDGALAGGICSCSTTIFNAALRAGLEMGDRRNHHYYINRYPVGLDATVWISNSGQRQTVSFTNDMEHPILIRGINRRSAVIFQIWGVPDGREVQLSAATITNRESAVEETRVSESMRPGQSRRVEWPANGFSSSVTRTVRDASGNVLHRDTFTSRYATINGITLVGPLPTQPAPPPEEEP